MSKDQSRNMRKQKENTARTPLEIEKQRLNDIYMTPGYVVGYEEWENALVMLRLLKDLIVNSAIIEEKHR